MEPTAAGTPLLIYDGDCGFCKRWIARWQKMTGGRVIYRPFQEVGSQFPQISPAAFSQAVQMVESDGKILSGADAVFRTLSYMKPQPHLLALEGVPGFMPIARWVYGFVARHRSFFSHFS